MWTSIIWMYNNNNNLKFIKYKEINKQNRHHHHKKNALTNEEVMQIMLAII